MSTTATPQRFSDEKIAIDSDGNGIGDKDPIPSRAPEDKILDQRDDDKVIHHTSNVDKEPLPPYQTGTSPTHPTEEKQTLSPDEKIVATTKPDSEDKSSVGVPTATSLTDSSWSHRSNSASYREHSFCHVNALRLNHNIIVDPNHQATYFVEVSGFVKGRQDVLIRQIGHDLAAKGNTLTADEGKTCPVAAFAQFPHGRENVTQLALGDHQHFNSVQWLDLSRTSENEDWTLVVPGKPSHTFQLATNLDSAPSTNSSAAQTSPLDNKSSTGSFKFVDTGSGAVVAAYSELKTMSSWKKRGKLRLYDGALSAIDGVAPEDLHLLVILCCAVMNEKRRRKTVRKWAGIGII